MDRLGLTTAFAALAPTSGAALAEENAQLVVNGEIEMITRTAAPEHVPMDEIRSG